MLTGLNVDEYLTRSDSNGLVSYLSDALGLTVGLVNSGGQGTSYAYQSFGATIGGSGSTNPYQFTGRENDGNGLYYFRGRYYSTTLQSFISQDPIGFAGGDTNLYSYATADSVNNTDPFGLCSDPGGSGVRFCIQQYIPDSSVWAFKGDDRGPTANGGSFRESQSISHGPNGELRTSTVPGISRLAILPKLIHRQGDQGPHSVSESPGRNGGTSIRATNSATNGLVRFAPSIGYDVTITSNCQGQLKVSGTHSAYPNLEIWEDGHGAPQLIYDYEHGGNWPESIGGPPVGF